MLRIYLDQAEWIDMSKCRTGHREGGRFQDAYDLSTRLVEQGDISFVISTAHYYETQRRPNPKSRRDLGQTIADLTKFHSIAPSSAIVPAEIRAYLTGQPLASQIQVFGVGFRHAFHTRMTLPEPDPALSRLMPPTEFAQLEERARYASELFVLAAPPEAEAAAHLMLETANKIHDSAQRFADGQTALGEQINELKVRHKLADVVAVNEISNFMESLIIECEQLGVDVEDLLRTRETILDLLKNLPSRWVESELRRIRLRNPQQPWVKNDLNDILVLAIAVPYCDIVVTEKQWARRLNDLGIAQRYNTVVLHDLADLPEAIVTATRTE
ncbi:hypothetical protein CH278_24625 [Rhodococcus sp. 05-2254-5]|uniref:hypothetical protein n=1 Tax=unclassified Rhodococcus (in: high G+C Gram-positive bacteria) TaxID=192944 RepID=UPI000B9C1147|nr:MULTISPECIES: hypothetical protein [unclassified Rhodococcus (in: high G+C Gram-positive bacteria)]OZE28110.1 hypothetical protein CH278_24625 [Rhodococcus sp. 05-2254-5]OZE52473.1 hypothetical protein CH269_23540 [Rhodococcus sp. 05-2254-1]